MFPKFFTPTLYNKSTVFIRLKQSQYLQTALTGKIYVVIKFTLHFSPLDKVCNSFLSNTDKSSHDSQFLYSTVTKELCKIMDHNDLNFFRI